MGCNLAGSSLGFLQISCIRYAGVCAHVVFVICQVVPPTGALMSCCKAEARRRLCAEPVGTTVTIGRRQSATKLGRIGSLAL